MSDFPQGADWWKGANGLWYAPDAPKVEAEPSDEVPASDDNSAKFGCGALIVAVIVVSILLSMCGSDDDDGGDDLQFGAFDVCREFVKDRLKAPGSASFRNYFDDDGEVRVTGSGDGPYTVRSTVDSENSFGAKIRTGFTCTVEHTGDGRYRLVSLNIDN